MIEKIKETAAFIKEQFSIIPETAIISYVHDRSESY